MTGPNISLEALSFFGARHGSRFLARDHAKAASRKELLATANVRPQNTVQLLKPQFASSLPAGADGNCSSNYGAGPAGIGLPAGGSAIASLAVRDYDGNQRQK